MSNGADTLTNRADFEHPESNDMYGESAAVRGSRRTVLHACYHDPAVFCANIEKIVRRKPGDREPVTAQTDVGDFSNGAVAVRIESRVVSRTDVNVLPDRDA